MTPRKPQIFTEHDVPEVPRPHGELQSDALELILNVSWPFSGGSHGQLAGGSTSRVRRPNHLRLKGAKADEAASTMHVL